jgi:hypothetical protein
MSEIVQSPYSLEELLDKVGRNALQFLVWVGITPDLRQYISVGVLKTDCPVSQAGGFVFADVLYTAMRPFLGETPC